MKEPEEEREYPIQKREEAELVPEGVSCTETSLAYYIRVRKEDVYFTIRVQKDPFLLSSISEDRRVEASSSIWHGIWGTN